MNNKLQCSTSLQVWCTTAQWQITEHQLPTKIYQAFIEPHISYCMSVWGYTVISQVTLMDQILLRAQKIIIKNKTDSLKVANYAITRIISFGSLLFYNNVRLMFNIVNIDMLHYYTGAEFLPNSIRNTRNTDSRKIRSIKNDRKSDELSFQFAGIRDWNSLPNNITQLKTKQSFSNNILKFLSQNLKFNFF